MGKYHVKISSGSEPIGNPPYFLTLSPFDDAGRKTYKTKDDLFADLSECTGTSKAGLEEILDQLSYKNFIISQAELTDDAVKRLTGTGW